MLLEQGQGKAIEPGKILSTVDVADSGFTEVDPFV